MQIQALNLSDPEKIFLAVKNVSGAIMTANANVCLVCDGASVDGISAIKPATASFMGWVGVADKDIADAGYGKAQSWGYRDSVLMSHEGTSVTVTIGDTLALINGVYGAGEIAGVDLSTLTDQAAVDLSKYIIVGSTITISAAAYISGIIRCL